MSFFDPDVQSQSGSPQSMMDILVMTLIFAFFGMMIFIGAKRYQMTYGKDAKWWWTCFIPLGIALLSGIQRMAFMRSFIYMQTVNSRKVLYAHWLSFLIPLLCIGAVILYNFLVKRSEARRVY